MKVPVRRVEKPWGFELVFARTDRYMRFERGVKMNRTGQLIEADDSTAYLFPDRDEPDRIELRGNSRITGGEGMGGLRLMRARDINLDYADDGRTLESATLAGQSAIRIASAGAGADQELSAEFITFELGADGAIKTLSSRDNVVLSLPAAKGFEIGSGFEGTKLTGIAHNDPFLPGAGGRPRTASNRSGGVQGGISNGEDVLVRVAFKPTATISQAQQTVTRSGEAATLEARGRHDPCVLPRAVPMVEAMVCLVLADHWLRQRCVDVLPPLR